MRRLVWILLLAAIAVTGWVEYRRGTRPSVEAPLRLVLAPAAEWKGVNPAERTGAGMLLEDCLECGTGLAVVAGASVVQGTGTPRDSLTVAMEREPGRTTLRLRLCRSGRPDREWKGAGDTPREAVLAALGWLRLERRTAEVILPKSSVVFWELAVLAARRVDEPDLKVLDASTRLVDREPDCAGTWLVRGRLTNNRILEDEAAGADLLGRCASDLERALALAPAYARAAAALGRFCTDTGNQRKALGTLFDALRLNPRSPRLFEALAYAARSAGLLDGASRALARRDAILGLSRGDPELAENTYLYLGDLDRFEQVLGPGSDTEPDTLRDFYRGYARLLRGDHEGALLHFQRSARPLGGMRPFGALATVYALGLKGHREEALARLRVLWNQRIPVRIPDGEYTFKLAEAFGFLESPVEAQNAANRAFAQGFGCLRWYRESPFLAGTRGTPRWKALESHIEARQALVEASFPADRFRF